MFGSRSFLRRQPVRVLLTSLIFSGMVANGAPPLWWSAGDPPVWDETLATPGANLGVANIGQAKHMVQRALETLETADEDLADEIRLKLTTPQPSAVNPSQTNPAVLDLTVPSPKTPEWIAKQKAPLLIGQLKAIAKPFYDVLHAEHPAWLEARLVENQTKDAANPANHYPWSSVTTDDQNKAVANIGQLKAVFSLPLEELNPNDSDGDGMPNAWELSHGLDPNDPSDAHGDADGDGLDNLREYQLGTNPQNQDSDGDHVLDGDEVNVHSTNPLSALDSDADGVPDDWELANGVTNGTGDRDGDGLIDSQEFAHGGNPAEKDTDNDGIDDGPEFLAGMDITDRDENNNTLSDGYEDPDDDGYITREEVLCRTSANEPQSYPDGSSAHGDPDGSGGEPPVLLVRDYYFDHQSVRGVLLWKQGDTGYLDGIVNEPPLQNPPAPPTEDGVEMEVDDRPKHYLTKTTVENASEQYEWKLTAAGLASPLNEVTAYSSDVSGTRTTKQITKKVDGAYVTENVLTGTATFSYSESTRFEGPVVTETPPPVTYDFSSPGPLPSWVGGFATTGDAVPKIVSDTQEKTDYKKKINEASEGATEEWNYDNSRVVTLSDEYTDGHLIEDLKSELADEDWGAAGFSNLVGLFLWDRFLSDRPHHYASMQDNTYRLVAYNAPNVASDATVKFHWKKVFIPQGGDGEIQTEWLSASGTKLTSGPFSGRYATGTHDLLHPDEPGETYAGYNQNHISAPEELSVVNPGEELFYKSVFTDSNGVTKTDIAMNRGKPIMFQVDLADQKSNPTLKVSGSGGVTLWERKKNGTWQNHSFPFKIPAEQAAGTSSDSGRYVLQGAAAGNVTLQIEVGAAVRSSVTLQVRRVDLDVDSDNSGDVNRSDAEEKVEFDAKKGGVVLPAGTASASDENGIPLHPDELGKLMMKLANTSSGEYFKIIYPQEVLRIWKTAPGQSPDAEDLIQSSHAYSVSDLALSSDGDAVFSIQPLASVAGLVRVEVSCGNASDGVLVNLLPVEFKTYPDSEPGPDKAHVRNLGHLASYDAHYSADWRKCVCKVWNSSRKTNLIDYLKDSDNPSIRSVLEQNLKWKINGTVQTSHDLNFGDEPDDDEQTHFFVELLPKTGSTTTIDRLIVNIVPRDTKTDFDAWYAAEKIDKGWLDWLPSVYRELGSGASNPEPGTCVDDLGRPKIRWNDPTPQDSFYHPGSSFEMRSKMVFQSSSDPSMSLPYGHQACYDANGKLLGEDKGVSAGSADREVPLTSGGTVTGHLNKDVIPFIWAAQLDGNPVAGEFPVPSNLTHPMLYQGSFLKRYMEVRPANANNKPELSPGVCP